MRRVVFAAVIAAMAAIAPPEPVGAQQAAPDGPRYTAAGALERPADYREWVFLASGLGMTYGPAAAAANRAPKFDNVFVTRDAYRQFMRTGTWPDRTMFILEIRDSVEHASIDSAGRTQGAVFAIEAAVKDQSRFAATNGWGYFDFGPGASPAASAPPLPGTASCYTCHKNNTAVEQTFVQFYPELMEVARRMGTVRKDFDPNRKP